MIINYHEFTYKIDEATVQDAILDIWIVTYQHELYIRQAIDSVLMQRTNYKYRIIICDDASSDRTQEILNEYKMKYSDIITLIISSSNTGSAIHDHLFNKYIRAKYFAIIDGDDYWTDPLKIEKQINFLERHQEYIAVTGNVRNVNEDGSRQHRDYDLYGFKEAHIYGKENVLNLEQVSHISAIVGRNFWREWIKM